MSSGAPELLEIRGRELVDLIAGALTRAARPGGALWSRVSREPHATFALRPGVNAERRAAATAPERRPRRRVDGTGWPATMEGAVRSGRAAARLLLDGDPAAA